MKKAFFVFYWMFLLIISLIVIPNLILSKEYAKLFITFVIIIFMVIVSVCLYVNFINISSDFRVSEEEIILSYSNRTEFVSITNISKIIITPYRYIFVADKKYKVTRIISSFSIEKHVSNDIYEIASNYHIPIINKIVAGL